MRSKMFTRFARVLYRTTPSLAGRNAPRRLRNASSWTWFRSGQQDPAGKWRIIAVLTAGTSGIGLLAYQWKIRGNLSGPSLLLPPLQAAEKELEKKPKVQAWERRYHDFSSLVFKGEPYMSAHDFLESLTQDEPRSCDAEVVDEKLVQRMLKHTPSRSKGSSRLFREIWNDGIITYGDYLFLVTALIKTRRQFEVAFRMIDVDCSDYIDLQEFSKVEESVTRQRDVPLIQQQKLDKSSLSIHLFGHRGRDRLYSKDFFKFIEDLQTEIREIEFNKFSGGSPTISEEDFARILLRHTAWELDPVFVRLRKRLKKKPGITFQQYCDFCQLLNSLDDFAVAMTMFLIAGKAVTEEEFDRAAKVCIGKSVDESVVSTVFQIFDIDGDGKLSYREFLAVMKDWKLRGFKIREKKRQGGWAEFKACIKQEMRTR